MLSRATRAKSSSKTPALRLASCSDEQIDHEILCHAQMESSELKGSPLHTIPLRGMGMLSGCDFGDRRVTEDHNIEGRGRAKRDRGGVGCWAMTDQVVTGIFTLLGVALGLF